MPVKECFSIVRTYLYNNISSSNNTKYLLLTSFARTVSYGPDSFSILMAQARSARSTWKNNVRIEQTRLIRCLLYGFSFFFFEVELLIFPVGRSIFEMGAKIPALFSYARCRA